MRVLVPGLSRRLGTCCISEDAKGLLDGRQLGLQRLVALRERASHADEDRATNCCRRDQGPSLHGILIVRERCKLEIDPCIGLLAAGGQCD